MCCTILALSASSGKACGQKSSASKKAKAKQTTGVQSGMQVDPSSRARSPADLNSSSDTATNTTLGMDSAKCPDDSDGRNHSSSHSHPKGNHTAAEGFVDSLEKCQSM